MDSYKLSIDFSDPIQASKLTNEAIEADGTLWIPCGARLLTTLQANEEGLILMHAHREQCFSLV